MDPLTGYCFGGIMLNVDDDITTRFPWRRGHAGREIPAKRARARDHLCPDSWIWYPLIPLVGVDSAEGTEVSAASDVATVSAENSLQNGSFEQPDVYQYRETSDVPYWKSTTTSGSIEIGSVFKNGNGDNDSLHMRTGEKVAAAEGSQFGKPATSNGNYSIYQRLATTQGAKYRWSLKHRARPSGSKSGFDTLAVITADTHGAEPPSFSWGGGTDLFHNMFEWMFGNGWDSPGWAFPDSGEGTFKLCSATLGNGTVNGYQSHWYRAGNDCSDTEHFPITWTITFVSSVFNQYTRNGWNEYEGEFAADGDDTVFALASYNTLNGNLAYGNLVDDVSVAAEGGDGGNLVTNGGFESPSLTKDGETGSANAPANAATQRPAPRITPPIGRIASPSQSANKRRLASLTGSVIALPYFVPRKPFEADVGAVRAWESPYATTKLNNR